MVNFFNKYTAKLTGFESYEKKKKKIPAARTAITTIRVTTIFLIYDLETSRKLNIN